MKVLLYFEGENLIQYSGIGRAFEHQKMALQSAGISYTVDPWDDSYDILHINTVGTNSETMIRHARELGKKVVYHAHSTEEDFRNSFVFSNLISPFVKTVLTNLYSKADVIITPTQYSKQLLEGYGIERPIYAISNGIDLKKYEYSEEKVKAYRKYFNLDYNQKVVIGVGLLFERKGILDFIQVASEMPDVKFIWFGDLNPLLVTPEIKQAMNHCPKNCYFPGYVKGPIIQGAYLGADCFFFPSYEETEGIVVLEALASKQNLVLRDIGAYHPWLTSGENCYMGQTNQDFIRLIRECLDGSLPSVVEEGYQVAQQRCIEKIGNQLKHVYEQLLSD